MTGRRGETFAATAQARPERSHMPVTTVFDQTAIAVIWDFDKTLIPGYMQEPLFARFEVDGNLFWKEVNGLPDYYRSRGAKWVSEDTAYLGHILAYVRHGRFDGLNNEMLRELGAELEFYPGMPEFMEEITELIKTNPEFHQHGITVEHYVVSTGLREMIIGSSVEPYLKEVWACEFAESEPSPGYLNTQARMPVTNGAMISSVLYAIDNTTKTRAIFEINKGTNVFPEIGVNDDVPEDARRVPFKNMIYVADGPSDIPVFSVVKKFGGRTVAVYEDGSGGEFEKARRLQDQGRVHVFGPADYTDASHTALSILDAVREIARRIVRERNDTIERTVGKPPTH